jgi:predicted enzyme related to lactoylglutathione lyase
MSKVIPVIPAKNMSEQCGFYESVGFTIVKKYTAPPYAVAEYDDITLHFWANKKQVPEENAICIIIEVDDVDKINEIFTSNLKNALGRIPRSGFPRITKVRELKEDRRFTLSDPSGNTIYFTTPAQTPAARTLDNEKHAKVFGAVYDLFYSHENPEKAQKALPTIMKHRDELSPADKEKLDKLVQAIENAQNIIDD